MSTEPPVLHTAEELFAHPECARIITMTNPDQNLHLERDVAGFRFTAGAPDVGRHNSREFASLDSVYAFWDEMPQRAGDLRGAIWQDISDYPLIPDDVRYRPLDGPVELHILPDSDQMTAHGPHVIYGPAEITMADTELRSYRITASDGWLVIEYPACTMRGGVRGILRPTRNVLDRLRLKYENYRLRHEESPPVVRPGVTVVYGKPPTDWQTVRQTLRANPSLPVE